MKSIYHLVQTLVRVLPMLMAQCSVTVFCFQPLIRIAEVQIRTQQSSTGLRVSGLKLTGGRVEYVKAYALALLGKPYKWGGNNALTGFDCSGLVLELLRSAGHGLPDMSSQQIFDHFKNAQWNVYGLGSLAFFGRDAARITHIAFLLNEYQMIEAGGGDSTTVNRSEAEAKNAVVRIRPIKARKDLVAVIKPDYSTIGVMR